MNSILLISNGDRKMSKRHKERQNSFKHMSNTSNCWEYALID